MFQDINEIQKDFFWGEILTIQKATTPKLGILFTNQKILVG